MLIRSIVDLLAHPSSGLPSDAGADWYVDASNIGTSPVDRRGGPPGSLPAVEVSLAEFRAEIDTFDGSQVFDTASKTAGRKASLHVDVSIVALGSNPMSSTIVSAQIVRIILANQKALMAADDSFAVHALRTLSGCQTRLDGPPDGPPSPAVSTRIVCRFLGELLFTRDVPVIEEINVRRIPWDSRGGGA